MKLSDFDFTLPDKLIAHHAVEPRDHAKLLHVNPNQHIPKKIISDHIFYELPNLLQKGDLLVINNTKVIQAHLVGTTKTGAQISVNLHKEIASDKNNYIWKAFAKPAKRANIGDNIIFDDKSAFHANIIDKQEGELTLEFPYSKAEFYQLLEKYGRTPLPPYIKNDSGNQENKSRYQTIYAKNEGAVAAPTAGLHFTENLMGALKSLGVAFAEVTLHVGAGTFLPVKSENITEHQMHSEYYEIDAHNAAIINHARENNGRIIAVGTTSMRVLETIASAASNNHSTNHPLTATTGETDIFITPGYQFAITDGLITNFHLPKSTLFMLVCAFAGYDEMRQAYQHAISSGYRFYSYGDGSLLWRKTTS